MKLLSLAWYGIWFYLLSCPVLSETTYQERLDITPLDPPSLLASFQFQTKAPLASYHKQHFNHIPRSLGQILQHAKTQELHLRFSTGRWDDERWGSRPRQGWQEGGTGVELWAWVEAESEEDSFARWMTLNNALSGLFCASINFIDSTRTTRPLISFEGTGSQSISNASELYLLHGALPHEVVCTENLTPFLKLLPCKGNAGIASLLDGHKLFDAAWQTMAIDIRTTCSNNDVDGCSIEMEQTVDMVLDTERSKRARDNPIPRPVNHEALLCNHSKPYTANGACFPSEASRGQSWTLAEIFGRPVQGSCLATDEPSSDNQSVCLHVPVERESMHPWHATETRYNSTAQRCYSLHPTENFDLVLSHLGPQTFNNHSLPALFASRSITGHGQERGGMQTLLTNPSQTDDVEFVYFESLPWFMKPYLSTLKTRLSDSTILDTTIVKETYYRPGLDRQRGTQLELVLSVPAASTVVLTYEFDKAILRYTEYPPDANRGFDVAPAVIRLRPSPATTQQETTSQHKSHERGTYIRTTSLLLPLPTPDFSMPYNVIILTSTVMALAFGSIFNLLVRRFVGADEVERWNVKALKEKTMRVWQAVSGKVSGRAHSKEWEKKVQ